MIPVTEKLAFSDLSHAMPRETHCDECGTPLRAGDEAASLGEHLAICRECFRSGWYGRLSSPGYLDATDWNGPFETEAEALHYTCEMYEVEGCDCQSCEVARGDY